MAHNRISLVRYAPRISPSFEGHNLEMICQGCPYSGRLFVAQRVVLTTLLLFATACSRLDPYATRFTQIGLGDSVSSPDREAALQRDFRLNGR